MSTETEKICAAGVVYQAKSPGPGPLWTFAETLKSRGLRVGGVVQDLLFGDDGVKSGIDIVALDNGERVALSRVTPEQLDNKVCTLNSQALAESTAPLRRALADGVDILIIEKFGEQEQHGRGVAAEITAAMMAGIPTLVAVPRSALDMWHDFTGGLTDILPAEQDALDAWWSKVQGQ